jgi:hypothetical protein
MTAPDGKYTFLKSHTYLLNFLLFVSIISHLLKEENFYFKYSFHRPFNGRGAFTQLTAEPYPSD